ncbi:MAG: motility protein A [Nitrospinota bacterium]
MDIATLIGIFLMYGMILMGIGAANLTVFFDPASALIVVGGTTGAVLVAYPLGDVMGAAAVAKNAFFNKPATPKELIALLVDMANKARKDGILVLQSTVDTVDNEFLKKGLTLAIDGMEPGIITKILETEIDYIKERHEAGAEILTIFGSFSPAFGMIGTLIGLVMMLQSMDDPSTIGPAMAIALITTFYGALLANTLFIPLAGKLKKRSGEEVLLKELALEGIMSITAGDNPRVVESKLHSFLAPKLRESVFQ